MRNLWKKSSWLDVLIILALYFVEMVPKRTSFRILSIDHICQPRQLLWRNLMWRSILWEINKKIFSHLKLSLVKWAQDGFLSELYRASVNQDGWLSRTCLCYSNGFNVNFILETLWQVSDDRLLGASGWTTYQQKIVMLM